MKRRALLVLLISCAGASAARGQAVDAQLFHPSSTANGFFAVDGAFPVRHLGGSAGVFAGYAHDPLVLRLPGGAVAPNGALIEHQVGVDVVASFGLIDRLELGLDLPVVAWVQGQGSLDGNRGDAGLGDLRVDLKILLIGQTVGRGHRLGFTLIAGGTAPTATDGRFLGQDGFTARPRLVFEWRAPRDRAAVALNFGAVLRGERQLADLYLGHQLSYGLGARVLLGAGVELLAEVAGLVGVAIPSGGVTASEAPGEVLAGVRWRAPFGLEIGVGGGLGITRGYGSPDGRAVLGVRYQSPSRPPRAPRDPDSDGDGTIDRLDRCPAQPGPRENGGCPDVDSDGDGVVDRLDACPQQPGVREMRGCPDVDSDGDTVVDRLDQCPHEPGPPQQHGCPEPDRDHDGIPDAADRCPEQAGTRANDGCPDVDSDGDGLVDRLDKCPFDPEVYNGLNDEDGCPDPGAPLAELRADRIQPLETIVFVGNTATVDQQSHKVLRVIARLLELHPEITKVRVEGHTDNRGSAIDNLDLSRARAAAVRKHLIQVDGVDAGRLLAQGFGPDRPIADNRSDAGRAKNRRIEFTILESKDAP